MSYEIASSIVGSASSSSYQGMELPGERVTKELISFAHFFVTPLITPWQYHTGNFVPKLGLSEQGGAYMPRKVLNTVIVDPQSLIRDVLSSLLLPCSFNIVGTFAAIHNIDGNHRTFGSIDLTILSGQSVDRALAAAEVMFAACPGGKVVFLFDELPYEDISRLCSSSIDGCVSLHVSHELLIRSIEFVVSDNVRIFTLDERLPCAISSARLRLNELAINRSEESAERELDSGVCLASSFDEESVFKEISDSCKSVVGKGSHRRH